MLIKFITRSLRSLGMILIFLFAAVCIFGSLFTQDIDDETLLGKFLDYTVSFENRFYDYRLRTQLDPRNKSEDIVLIKIDDYSLEKLGVFPIPRTNYAKMIDKLSTFGAKVVSMDVLFSEESPPLQNLSPDEIMAQSIKDFQSKGGRVFIGYSLTQNKNEALEEPPLEMLDDAIMTRNAPEVDLLPSGISKYTFPIQKLIENGVGVGYLDAYQDGDGVFRRYKLLTNVSSIYYGSLALNSFEAFTGEKHTVTIASDKTGEMIIDGKKLELGGHGETKVRYIGSEEAFDSLSLFDVINADDNDSEMKKRLQGKMIFVGSTALGAHDFRPSPIDHKMPGVYSHMNMANMLLKKYFFQGVNDSVRYSLIILTFGMILFLIVYRLGHPLLDAVSLVVVVISCYLVDKNFFLPNGYELKLFYAFFCFGATYTWITLLNFYESNKEKKQIRGTFARYVAPTVVDQMLKDPDKLHVGGSKMDITCLFSDVRDFTKISEGLTATELAHSLNMYMGKMTAIVFDTKGTLDKYIGDAIVAIWGAPLDIGNHAQEAVQGAIKMMDILPSINEEFTKLNRPTFEIGIGLNTGECSVGNMGSDRIFSYTALGDNMNLGARLEGLCKYYGTGILISQYTLERLDTQHIKYRPIDKVIVKGKTTPVEIFEVLYSHHFMTKDPEALHFYLEAHKLFLEKDFQRASAIFGQILMSNEKDKPSKRLYELCQKYLAQPELAQDDFDVTKMTEK